MTEKTTSHVAWLIVTILFFLFAFPLGLLSLIGWVCAASSTRKHNAKVAAYRHHETIQALRHGRGTTC